MLVKQSVDAPPSLDLRFLEDRILYSGAPLASDLLVSGNAGSVNENFLIDGVDPQAYTNPDACPPPSGDAPTAGNDDFADRMESSLQELDSLLSQLLLQDRDSQVDDKTPANGSLADTTATNFDAGDTGTADTGFGDTGGGRLRELLVIDTALPDYERLLAALQLESNSDCEFTIVTVDRSINGVELVREQLATSEQKYSAVHLVTHGFSGGLQLGDAVLTAGSLGDYASLLQAWQTGLTADADLFLYGCSIADGASGIAFVDQLSALLNVDVAASTDATGASALGGDWDLEYRAGRTMEDRSLSIRDDDWDHLLLTYTVRDNFSNSSWSNNDGTNAWAALWTETDAGGTGTTTGNILIAGGQLQMLAANGADALSRQANLTGAHAATLTFTYDSTLDNNGLTSSITLDVSSDGITWTTLDTFSRTQNTAAGSKSYDLTSYISNQTRVRWDVGTAASGAFFLYVDNFQISYDINTAPTAVADAATAVEAGGVSNGTAGTNPTGNVLNNDTDADSGDTKTVTGVAAGVAGSASGNVGSSVTGTYGSISIASNGTYTYTVNNSNATVQALRTTSNTLTDTFTYTMRDTLGLSSTTQITVTIQGANDAPTAGVDAAVAVEAGGISNGTAGTNPTGNVLTNDTDVDTGDTKTLTGVVAGVAGSASGNVGSSVLGTYGSISIASNGAYTYTVDNSNATVQALRTTSNTLTDTFTYTMRDTLGLTSTTQITVTIQGANDAPTAVSDTAIAVEAGGVSNGTAGTNPTGNVVTNDPDPDSGDTKTVTGVAVGVVGSASGNVGSSVAGSYGSISIAANGGYSYTVNNSNSLVEALRTSSNTLTDVFTYTMQDASGSATTAQVTVTIQGANDGPVAVADSATAVEAGGTNNGTAGSNPTGNVLTNDTDVDAGDTKTVAGVAAGVVGSASTNVGSTVSGAYGALIIAADGSYAYQVDNTNAAVQALRSATDTLTDIFTYTMRDTAGAFATTQLTITIQGSNDAISTGTDTATAIEAGGVSNGTAGSDPTGNVLTNDSDVDSLDTQTVTGVAAGVSGTPTTGAASNVAGSYGSINIASDGSYTYTVDNSNATVQALRTSADTIVDVFTYSVSDSGGLTSTGRISVTITGSNDSPTAVADLHTIVEAGGTNNSTGSSTQTGNILVNDTDPDANDTKTVTAVAFGAWTSVLGGVGTTMISDYGTMTVNANGTFTYWLDNSLEAVEALRTSSDTLQEVFTYMMQDTAGASSLARITMVITGGNDAPQAVADSFTATESRGYSNALPGSNATGNVLSNDADIDSSDTRTVIGVAYGVVGSASSNVGTSLVGAYGSITIAANGSLTYVVDQMNASVQGLRLASESINDVFSYTMRDAGGLTSTTQVTIRITGGNDAPTAVADQILATEAGGYSNTTPGVNPTGNLLRTISNPTSEIRSPSSGLLSAKST